MAIKIIRGHLHQPADNPLDDYRTPAQQQEAAAAAREQHGQTIANAQAASTWHRKRR